MSGGSFNYAYSRVQAFAEELDEKLENAGKPHPRYQNETQPEFSPEVTARLRELVSNARVLAKHMRAAEWLYSFDYSEETLLREMDK